MRMRVSERLFRPLRLGAVSAVGAFGILATVERAIGVDASVASFLLLLGISVLVGAATFLTVRRRFIDVKSSGDSLANNASQLGFVIRRELGPSYGASFDELVQDYRGQIRDLRDQLRAACLTSHDAVKIEVHGPLRVFDPNAAGGPVLTYPGSLLVDQVLVTNKAFEAFLKENPDWQPEKVAERYGVPYFLAEFIDGRSPSDKWDHPVVWVSWFAAAAYCNWRSRADECREVYAFHDPFTVTSDLLADGWRLPTVAEWESVARLGFDPQLVLDPTRANYGLHYRGTTAVGRFPSHSASGPSVFDVFGNVKQWCQDADPRIPANRAFKGASWMDPPRSLRVDATGGLPPQNTNPDFGFRCVRMLIPHHALSGNEGRPTRA